MSDALSTELPALAGTSKVIIPYASPRPRGRRLLTALGAGAALALASIVLDQRYLSYFVILESRDWTRQEYSTVERLDDIALWLMRATILVRLATFVLWCAWKHRCHRNLPALGGVNLQFTPWQTVLVYFVPLLNFFMPYQAMREIQWGSNPSGGQIIDCRFPHVRASVVLVAWWIGFFLAAIVAQLAVNTVPADGDEVSHFIAHSYVSIAASAAFIVVTAIAARVVYGIVDRQEHRAALIGVTPSVTKSTTG